MSMRLRGNFLRYLQGLRARLAGPGLLTITSDQSQLPTLGDTPLMRWMSLKLDPNRFGPKEGCSAKESVCYALGVTMHKAQRVAAICLV